MGNIELEKKIVSSVVTFASDKHKKYVIEKRDLKNVEYLEIYIGMWGREDWAIKDDFHHRIFFNDQITEENTIHVAHSPQSRNLYVDFIKFMNSKDIELHNDFEGTWKSNPRRYPL